jgi:hypothetical protein
MKGRGTMEFIFKETKLTDGSRVHDVQIIANGSSAIIGRPVCIFSCRTESDAYAFLRGVEKLAEKHCDETFDEIEI